MALEDGIKNTATIARLMPLHQAILHRDNRKFLRIERRSQRLYCFVRLSYSFGIVCAAYSYVSVPFMLFAKIMTFYGCEGCEGCVSVICVPSGIRIRAHDRTLIKAREFREEFV